MIDQLLSRLERVKQTGPGRWIASCPTRDDKCPSMTIRQLDDGRVLIHDFAGSAPDEILAAVGLDWSALFPDRTTEQAHPERRPFPAMDILRALAFEATIVMCAAAAVRRGDSLSDQDYDRLAEAAARFQQGVRLAGGGT